MVQITLNGNKKTLTEEMNVLDLLKELQLNPNINIVEKNKDFVSKDFYQKTMIQTGDKIEIIRFVGGG